MRPTTAALLVLLSAAAAPAQTAPLAIPDGTIIEARMVTGVDSKKAKAGDSIQAETIWAVRAPSGTLLIPVGSRLFGHITVASRQSLGLVIDSVRLADGSLFALDVTIQGVDVKLEIGSGTTVPQYSYSTTTGEPFWCLDTPRLPVERVTITQEEHNEAVLHTNRSKVKLPKHAQVILLAGSLTAVCRGRGAALLQESPSLAPSPSKADIGPALVVADHRIVGCARSASAWIDYPYFMGIREGTTIEGVMERSLESRRAKQGDLVVAAVSRPVPLEYPVGGVLRQGALLLGHVTQASARATGAQESILGVVFDRVVLGSERLPMSLSLQSIKPLPGAQSALVTIKSEDCGVTLRSDADSVAIPKGTPVVLLVGSINK